MQVQIKFANINRSTFRNQTAKFNAHHYFQL